MHRDHRPTALVGAALAAFLVLPVGQAAAVPAPAATGAQEPVQVQELDLSPASAPGAARRAAPEELAPQAVAPEGDAPPADVPEADAPEAEAPQTDAPETDASAATADASVDVLTAEIDTDPFSVLGLTWDAGPDDVTVAYRVRVDGAWTDWQEADGDVAPDADRAEGRDAARAGTDPVVALGADGIQVRADSATGTVTGLKAVLVDPGARVADATMQAPVPVPGAPAIYGRPLWGADESLRTCNPDYSTQMAAAAVHHTASTNAYGPDDVPGILRGILAYHTRPEAGGGRGWCDIGYNFLVDKFGRIFEGRAGGTSASVVGVHTGGFNSRTIGIAAIGDYGAAGVPDVLTEAVASLVAWKFSILGIRAGVDVTLVSGGGSSRWPAGTPVTFSTIFAHRDAQLTSCPGQNLYNLLPYLRTRVAQLANPAVEVSPRGVVESVRATPEGITVTGWAFDPETTAPIQVRVLRDHAVVATVTASTPRPDVKAAHPGAGDRHGYSVFVPAPGGSSVVCVTAVNVANGTDVSLGCRTATVRNAAPIGAVDVARGTDDHIELSGWALDPDTSAPTYVHVYVDGVGVAVRADASRPDVAAAFGKGDRHGFSHRQRASQGNHQVCTYAIDTHNGPATLLECRVVTVGTPRLPEQPPVGVVDAVSATNTTLTVSGWAFDPNAQSPTDVHVYVDGVGVAVRADRDRPDVQALYRRDPRVGFTHTRAVAPGPHTVCAYAIDRGPSAPSALGCYTVVVPDSPPFGAQETTWVDNLGFTLNGWTVDPDTHEPTDVHVYVDGVGTALRADRPRADIAAAFGRGTRHGYSHRVAAAPGAHSVCVYAINTNPAGGHTLLGCSTVVVPDSPPFGALEETWVGPGWFTLNGWTVDPDTHAPTDVHVYVDGVGTALRADRPRPDIAAAFGRGDRHGFSHRFNVARGTHTACVYAINTAPAGPPTLLGCVDVRVR